MARSAPKKTRYSPADLIDMEPAEMRQIYQRLRKTANRRMDRLKAAGYGEDARAEYKFPTSGEISDRSIRRAVLQVSKYLRDPRTTISGRTKQAVKTVSSLQEHGYNIGQGDLKKFGDFMEWSREKYRGRVLPPSDVVASIYEEAQRLNMPAELLQNQFSSYIHDQDRAMNLLDEMRSAEIPDNRNRMSAAELKRRMAAR